MARLIVDNFIPKQTCGRSIITHILIMSIHNGS